MLSRLYVDSQLEIIDLLANIALCKKNQISANDALQMERRNNKQQKIVFAFL